MTSAKTKQGKENKKRKLHKNIKLNRYWSMAFVAFATFALIFLVMHYNSLPMDIEGSLRETMKRCAGSDKKWCFKEAANDLLQRFTLSEILEALEMHQLEPEFFYGCHLFSHYLGQAAYRKTRNAKEILSENSPGCFNGALHGAVEGYFMEKPELISSEDNAAIVSEMRELCGTEGDYPNQRRFDTCYHGLGHAIMFIVSNNLPSALEFCDAVATDRDLRYRCYAGAFMANIESANDKDHPTDYFKKDDPLFPCPLLRESYQDACYTLGVLGSVQGDLHKSIRTCYRVPESYQLGCFKMFGRDRVMHISDPAKVKDTCDKIGNATFAGVCMQEAAHQLLERLGINSSLPFEICRLAAPQDQRDCFSKLGNGLKSFTRDTENVKVICETQAGKYAKDCAFAK